MTNYNGLTILIPSRNRADFAINAVKSVLDYIEDCNLKIVISDNSSTNSRSEQLKDFCESLNNPDIKYIRPDKELAMTVHWNWAMTKAIELFDTNHYTILSDRMVFKKDVMPDLIEIIKSYPNELISFIQDGVVDIKYPITYYNTECTEKIYQVDCNYLLELASKYQTKEFFPRQINSIMPISLINKMKKTFGQLFDSFVVDYEFCFKALYLLNTFVYYDKGILIHYGMSVSNGSPVFFGLSGKTQKDFIKLSGFNSLNDAYKEYLLLPEVNCITNAVFLEYLKLQKQINTNKLPPMNKEEYLNAIYQETNFYINQKDKKRVIDILKKQGFKVPKSKNKLDYKKYLKTPKLIFKEINKYFDYYKLTEVSIEDSMKMIEYMNNNPPKKVPESKYSKLLLANNGRVLI